MNLIVFILCFHFHWTYNILIFNIRKIPFISLIDTSQTKED